MLCCLTGCVGAVRPSPEVVLQQLVRPCGTGSSHQPHCGLMKKHLWGNTKRLQGHSDCLPERRWSRSTLGPHVSSLYVCY